MDIKLIATDLDGTLLRNDKTISKLTKETLNRFLEKNGKLIIATGRAYFGTKWVVEELGLQEGYLITYNGAKIYDIKSEEVIFYSPLEKDITIELINISREKGVHLNLYQGDDWYVENSQRDESKYYTNASGKCPVEQNFDTFSNFEMIKALFIADKEVLEKLSKELKIKFSDRVHITFSHWNFLEVLSPAVNKGNALKKATELIGIDRDKIVAFGDELNDREMIQYAGVGVAMNNANPELKKIAEFETLSNQEDGVAEFILKNILNSES